MSYVVECPICFKNFSADFIQSHAQKCTGSYKIDATETAIGETGMPSAKKAKLLSPRPHAFFSSKAKKSLNPEKGNPVGLGRTESANAKFGGRGTGFQFTGKAKTNKNYSCCSTQSVPLAELSRPTTAEDYIGQEKVLGQGSILSGLLKSDIVPSMIFWGPPGCGKTSLAHVIAQKAKHSVNNSLRFVKMSATNSGKADVQAAIEAAKNDRRMLKRKTILFIDEIHRFNKLQQDTFLPHVEDGTIILLGATTENPSFSLNSALLSRCRVIVLEKLTTEEVKSILLRALEKFESDVKLLRSDDDSTNSDRDDSCQTSSPDCEVVESNNNIKTKGKITIAEGAIVTLASLCDGDARTALSGLQMAIQASRAAIASGGSNDKQHISVECIKKSLQRSHVLYDRAGDQHYDIISAFHKSIRGSDDSATLYWLARMLEGGEDPKFVSRRLIRIASEDIGLADPNALNLAVSTQQACEMIGMPECDVVLAQCAVYLARAPKSVEVYMAYSRAKQCVQNHEGPMPGVPLHLRNARSGLMRTLGYGRGYRYDSPAEQTYLPETMLTCNFFEGDIPQL